MTDAEHETAVPVSWYAVLTAERGEIKAYLDRFELMTDPQLQPLEQDGKEFGKLTYSGFSGYTDYEDVLNETRELILLLTGALWVSHESGAISIDNIVGVFEAGREERFPPYRRSDAGVRFIITFGTPIRKEGVQPRATAEQYMVEYAIRSGNPLVKEALRYMSDSLNFFNLYKILEIIRWGIGNGDKKKGYRLICERGWVTDEKLWDFSDTANEAYRHWNENPAPKMDIKEARAMVSRIVKGWIAEKAGLPMLP
jgi:hypothetical protein